MFRSIVFRMKFKSSSVSFSTIRIKNNRIFFFFRTGTYSLRRTFTRGRPHKGATPSNPGWGEPPFHLISLDFELFWLNTQKIFGFFEHVKLFEKLSTGVFCAKLHRTLQGNLLRRSWSQIAFNLPNWIRFCGTALCKGNEIQRPASYS